MRVYFTNMGCKLNQAEVEQLGREFRAAGHQVVAAVDDCDLHVINTCTVTHVAARQARKLARRAGRLDAGIRTVLTGCYASASPQEAAGLAGVDLVVPNERKAHLVAEVHAAMPELAPASPAELAVPYLSAPELLAATGSTRFGPLPGGHARAMVKIGDGCNMRCSFCIIPFTRGREASRPLPEVVAEVRSLVATGFREVVVTGVQISSYRWQGRRLYDLARALLEETAVERLRLTSIAPWDFDDRLFPLFVDRRLCRHVHMSLQSGDTQTLRRMRRPYSPAAFAQVAERIRDRLPGTALTTDVIVGFPGETDAEHAASRAFVERMAFARVHVFPYSPRPGTAAPAMAAAVDPAVQRARMAQMLQTAAGAERAFWRQHLGGEAQVLWEAARDGCWQGLTDNYIRVRVPGPAAGGLRNSLSRVRLVALEDDAVRGELLATKIPRVPSAPSSAAAAPG
jgi:threonylcarbamoyladenosine tRNA methylthiotransferase MtaB